MFVNAHGNITEKEQAAYIKRAEEKFGPELMEKDHLKNCLSALTLTRENTFHQG